MATACSGLLSPDTFTASAEFPDGHLETATALAEAHPHIHGADQIMHAAVAEPGDSIVDGIGAASHTEIGSETSWNDFFSLLANGTPYIEAISVTLADGALIEIISFFAAAEIVIDTELQKHTQETVKKWELCYAKLQTPERQRVAHKLGKDESLRTVFRQYQANKDFNRLQCGIASYLAVSKIKIDEALQRHMQRIVKQWKRSYDSQTLAGLGKEESLKNVMLQFQSNAEVNNKLRGGLARRRVAET
ncbi:MAG: hypothetical protein Q9164_007843 [Protoblastenia rupestris]